MLDKVVQITKQSVEDFCTETSHHTQQNERRGIWNTDDVSVVRITFQLSIRETW